MAKKKKTYAQIAKEEGYYDANTSTLVASEAEQKRQAQQEKAARMQQQRQSVVFKNKNENTQLQNQINKINLQSQKDLAIKRNNETGYGTKMLQDTVNKVTAKKAEDDIKRKSIASETKKIVNADIDDVEKNIKKNEFQKKQQENLSRNIQTQVSRTNFAKPELGEVHEVSLTGTAVDLGARVGKGALKMLEGPADTLQYLAADVVETYGGTMEWSQRADKIRENADFDSTGAIFGTNEREEDNFKKDWMKGIQENSMAGEKLETFGEVVGGVGGLMALMVVGNAAGIPSLVTQNVATFSSAYGNTKSALRASGIDDETATKEGIKSGLIESVTENIFGLRFGQATGWGDRFLKSVEKNLNGPLGKILSYVLETSSEGVEELIGNWLNVFSSDLNNAITGSDYQVESGQLTGNVWEDFLNTFNEETWDEFIMASLSTVLVNGSVSIVNNAQKKRVIQNYADFKGISFEEAKKELTITEDKIENNLNKNNTLESVKQLTDLGYTSQKAFQRVNEMLENKSLPNIQVVQNEKANLIANIYGNEFTEKQIDAKIKEMSTLIKSNTITDKKSLGRLIDAYTTLQHVKNEFLQEKIVENTIKQETSKQKRDIENKITNNIIKKGKKFIDNEGKEINFYTRSNAKYDEFDFNKVRPLGQRSAQGLYGIPFENTNTKYGENLYKYNLESEKTFISNETNFEDINNTLDYIYEKGYNIPSMGTLDQAKKLFSKSSMREQFFRVLDNVARNQNMTASQLLQDLGYDVVVLLNNKGEIEEFSALNESAVKNFNRVEKESKQTMTIGEINKKIDFYENLMNTMPEDQRDAYVTKINNLIDQRTELEELSSNEIGADIEYIDEEAPIELEIEPPEIADVLREMPQEVISLQEKMQNNFKDLGNDISKTMTNYISSWYPFEKLARKTKNTKILPLLNNIYNADSQAQADISLVQRDLQGNVVGKSIDEIFKPIEKANLTYEFGVYMYLSRQATKALGTADVFGENLSSTEAKEIVAEIEADYPEFKEYKKDVLKYEKNLRNMMVESGVISQKTSDLFEKIYPEYVRIYRDVYQNQSPIKREGGVLKISSPVKTATGGTQDLIPLKEALARQTQEVRRASARNIFGNELYNILGGTNVKIEADSIKNNLLEFKDKNYGYIFYKNGKSTMIPINEYMKMALEPKTYDLNTITKITSKLSSAQRALITNLNPIFAVTNVSKDFFDAVINTKHPSTFLLNYGKAWGLMTSNSSIWKTYLAMGAKNTSYFDYKQGFIEENTAKKILKSPIKMIEFLADHSEQVTRFAEYLNTLSHGGSQFEAMYDAAEVTVNFKKGGIKTKKSSQYGFNYVNASVLGTYKAFENVANAKGGKAMLKLATTATLFSIVPSLLNSLLYKDDDDYEKLTDDIKEKNFLFKTGKHTFLKIPKGRLSSVISRIPQRLVEGKGLESFKEQSKFTWDQIGVANPLESNLYYPLWNVMKNGNEATNYYGSLIVPQRYKGKSLEDQLEDPGLTEFSKIMSKGMHDYFGWNMSPFLIDYLYDQYSGGLGDITMPLMTEEADKNVLEAKFTVDSITNNKNVNELYNELEKYSSPNNDDDAIRYKFLNSKVSETWSYYSEIRKIEADKTLTQKEKRKKANSIRNELNKLAEKALKESKQPIKTKTGKYGKYNYGKYEGEKYKQIGLYLYKYDEEEKKWNKVNVRSNEYKEFYKD